MCVRSSLDAWDSGPKAQWLAKIHVQAVRVARVLLLPASRASPQGMTAWILQSPHKLAVVVASLCQGQ